MLLKFLMEVAHGYRARLEAREKYGKTERALLAFLTGEMLGRLYATTAELFPLPEEFSSSPAA